MDSVARIVVEEKLRQKYNGIIRITSKKRTGISTEIPVLCVVVRTEYIFVTIGVTNIADLGGLVFAMLLGSYPSCWQATP